jgi:pyridoxal 5'-phosphate synthase pdxS subunit
LGEALRRIHEGAAMIRTKGEAGTGNVVNAVTHMRAINDDIRELYGYDKSRMNKAACDMGVPMGLVEETRELGRLSVVNFAAGGIATPADAALMMALGSDGVFVGSGIFKSENPAKMAHAIVQAVIHYQDPARLAEISKGLGTAMIGLENQAIEVVMAERGI